MELAMEFATFCNICFIKESLRKIEKTEHLLNILMVLIEKKIIIKEQEVYLCLNCCEKLKSYDQFKEMCLRNFIDFRVEYFELKKKLEINSDPHVENKLRNFIETKVYKTCDTIKPSDSESFIKIEYNTICMAESKKILTEKDEGNSCNYDFQSVTCKTENIECDNKEEYKFHTELDLENSEDDCELSVPVENIKKGDSCVEKDIGVSESSSKNELSEALESALSRENKHHTVMDLSQYEKPEQNKTLNINTQPINQKTPENECKICKEKFVNDDNLKKHMLVHNGERPFVCTVCNKFFTKSSILKAHQLVHTGEKRYKCDICNKTYTKLSNLKSHQHSHTGKKPYVCKVCNKTYAHLRTLKAHEYEHTGKMPHICNICNKTFPLPERLTVHMHIHSDEKPYTCLVCNKTFRRLLHLKEHERVHTGEKPYACSMCDKTFGTSGYLKLHLLVHTGEKPYTCRVCEKSFRHISHLKAHERVHIDEKPYECTICNKRFTHLSSYKSHKLTHTGEKPYSCTACKNTFRQLSTLRRHERTHTGVKPYSCDKCKKTYREKGDLRLHQQKACVLNDLQLEGVTTQLSEET